MLAVLKFQFPLTFYFGSLEGLLICFSFLHHLFFPFYSFSFQTISLGGRLIFFRVSLSLSLLLILVFSTYLLTF